MKTNLSSQITLNRVSPRYYRPENAFERSVLTRLEKIPTDIYESPEEGANQIALDIAQVIRDKQKAGRFCILALAGGNSPRNVYSALVRMHKEEGLSFRNVVVFNLYEYYPLASDAVNSNLNALKEMLLDHVDIDMQNVFSPNGTIAKDFLRMERQTDSQRHRLAVSADRKADFEVDQQRLQRKRLKRIACPLRFGI